MRKSQLQENGEQLNKEQREEEETRRAHADKRERENKNSNESMVTRKQDFKQYRILLIKKREAMEIEV